MPSPESMNAARDLQAEFVINYRAGMNPASDEHIAALIDANTGRRCPCCFGRKTSAAFTLAGCSKPRNCPRCQGLGYI